MARKDIIENEPSFLIHQRPYSETSQIIHVFSHKFGRIDLIAKGSKRPKSKFKSLLQPFLPLRLSWSGRSQLKTLREAEISGENISNIKGKHLIPAFYLNELILSFLKIADPYPDLFKLYAATLHDLSESKSIEPSLRRFEMFLLSEIGYAINFETESLSKKPIEAGLNYVFIAEQGFVSKRDQNSGSFLIKGRWIQAINEGDFSDPETLRCAKKILRLSIQYHLDGKELKSKKVFKSIERKSGG